MNCNRIEELLPGYADGDITADDKRQVDVHVETCDACRESLAFFLQMENQLVERSALRPSAAVAARRVVQRLGLRNRLGWFDALTSVPGAIAGGLVALGVVWLAGGHALTGLFGGRGVAYGDAVVDHWVHGVDFLAAGSELTLPIVTAGLTALILLTGSWMVLRFVRE
jgi:anti-sigma factor RsiW